MRALGGTRAQVVAWYLCEAGLTSGAGGVAGLLVGVGGAAVLSRAIPGLEAQVPPGIVVAALVMAVGIGLLAGVVPALRAAQLDPVKALRAELTRLHPAEILVPDNQNLNDGMQGHQTPYPAWRFEPGKCTETLLTHFKTSTLDGFGLKPHSLPVRAAGTILQYLKETQPDSLTLLTGLRSYSLNEFMTLDAPTRRNLELDETLHGERKGSLLGTLG